MSLIRKHGAVLQAWACLDLVKLGFSWVSVIRISTAYNIVHIKKKSKSS